MPEAFAWGGLASAMLPEAFEETRDWTGALVVLGFAAAIALSAL